MQNSLAQTTRFFRDLLAMMALIACLQPAAAKAAHWYQVADIEGVAAPTQAVLDKIAAQHGLDKAQLGTLMLDDKLGVMRWWPVIDGAQYTVQVTVDLSGEKKGGQLLVFIGSSPDEPIVNVLVDEGRAVLASYASKDASDDAQSHAASKQLRSPFIDLADVATVPWAEMVAQAGGLLLAGSLDHDDQALPTFLKGSPETLQAVSYLSLDALVMLSDGLGLNPDLPGTSFIFNPGAFGVDDLLAIVFGFFGGPQGGTDSWTTDSCQNLQDQPYSISCPSSRGYAICRSAPNNITSGSGAPSEICIGLAMGCRNWRDVSCYCSNELVFGGGALCDSVEVSSTLATP